MQLAAGRYWNNGTMEKENDNDAPQIYDQMNY